MNKMENEKNTTVGTVPKIPHCRNSSKNTTLLEQFQKIPHCRKFQKKYHTVGTVPKNTTVGIVPKKIPNCRNSSIIQ
jgi:hypothetical protein